MYKKIIDGGPEPFRTGMPSAIDKGAIRGGFEQLWLDPIDAPDCMPAGGIHRIEWKSHTQPGVQSWFPSQIISLRGYQ